MKARHLFLALCLLGASALHADTQKPVKVAMPDTVSVTPTGHSFHKLTHNLPGAVLVLRVDAEEAGFVPCRVCFSDRKKTASLPYDRLRKILGQK